MRTLPSGSSARYTFPYLLSLITFSSLKLFVYCCRDATENEVAEVGVLVRGGELVFFSGRTMGFTTTLSMGGSGGGGGGGG